MAIRPINPLLYLLISCVSASLAISNKDYSSFITCFSLHSPPHTNISDIIHNPDTPFYTFLLGSTIQNLVFTSTTTPKPFIIITPTDESHVQAAVICCRNHSLSIRVRSGGHDYEGLSYRSLRPDDNFAMIDLANLRSVKIDVESGTAWVQSGATLGEFYYKIAKKSSTLAFPAGSCPTVCVGGHISGGGFGVLLRKYGLAADHVLDAKLVDVNGCLLDRKSMGDDLFWAIRGGGAASFGVIVSWKVRLVAVPPTVSVFTVRKDFSQGALELVGKYQHIGHRVHHDLFLKVDIEATGGADNRVEAVFKSLFLGSCANLLQYLSKIFPELVLESDDCKEMSWVDSLLYYAGHPNGGPIEVLLDRGLQPKEFYKAKSDYLTGIISEAGLRRIWEKFREDGAGSMYIDPYGGRMDEIADTETPFPHRNGTHYSIQYFVGWNRDENGTEEKKHLNWINSLYKEMSAYVSSNPRAAYLNYRDLDLGWNEEGRRTRFAMAKGWGEKYFKMNFNRLARVKGVVDPESFFWNEQSIPPISPKPGKGKGYLSSWD